MKKNEIIPKLGTLDVAIGIITALMLTDWFIQPLFDNPEGSYGAKLLSWLIVTVLFVCIAFMIMFASMWLRSKIRR